MTGHLLLLSPSLLLALLLLLQLHQTVGLPWLLLLLHALSAAAPALCNPALLCSCWWCEREAAPPAFTLMDAAAGLWFPQICCTFPCLMPNNNNNWRLRIRASNRCCCCQQWQQHKETC